MEGDRIVIWNLVIEILIDKLVIGWMMWNLLVLDLNEVSGILKFFVEKLVIGLIMCNLLDVVLNVIVEILIFIVIILIVWVVRIIKYLNYVYVFLDLWVEFMIFRVGWWNGDIWKWRVCLKVVLYWLNFEVGFMKLMINSSNNDFV